MTALCYVFLRFSPPFALFVFQILSPVSTYIRVYLLTTLVTPVYEINTHKIVHLYCHYEESALGIH